jgi:hypothetical protein
VRVAEHFGPVGEFELEGIEHGHRTRGASVEVIAQGLLEHAVVDPGIGLAYADAVGEQAQALGV